MEDLSDISFRAPGSSQQTYSQGSDRTYKHSTQSSGENDSEKIDPDEDDVKLPFFMILVMWTQMLKLFLKCHRPGCGSAVLADNIIVKTNGLVIKMH